MRNRCLGIFLVFITIPLVMLSIIQLGSWKLIQPSYYKELLKKSNSYAAIVKAVPPAKNQDSGNILAVIQDNLTPTWLAANVEKNLDQLDLFLYEKKENLDISIDITPFHESIIAGAPSEIQDMIPKELSLTTYSKFLSDMNNLMKNTVIDDQSVNKSNSSELQKQITSTQNLSKQFDQNSKQIKRGLFMAKTVAYIVFGLAILMLFFIALISRHWLPAIFRWLGSTLFISGGLTMGISFLIQSLAIRFSPINGLKTTVEIKQVLVPLYQNIVSNLSSSAGIISLIVTISGLILLIISYILPKFIPEPPRPNPAPAPQEVKQ